MSVSSPKKCILVVVVLNILSPSRHHLVITSSSPHFHLIHTSFTPQNNLTMLRKTLQDEIQAKTSLSNKMMSEQEDFDKYQNDSSRKLARVSTNGCPLSAHLAPT